MKNLIRIIYIFTFTAITTLSSVSAAYLYTNAPSSASSNREPLSFSVFINGEDTIISGISGDLSFPSNLFDVKVISTQNGIVPLWITQPKVSDEKFFDQRTHIIFEGIVPGGFDGVRSPYINGTFPGIIFTITLIPKGEGNGTFELNNVELHAYDDKGTIISNKGESKSIFVPHLSGKEVVQNTELTITDNSSVTMLINQSDLVNDNAPYVYIREENPSRTVRHIEVAESDEYSPSNVSSYEWHTVNNPYLLVYKSRNKYVHAKIVYTNNTFTYKTIAPVENSQAFVNLSRILLYIVVAISLLYHYGKNFLHIASKNRKKN